jgi:hypothetical protein
MHLETKYSVSQGKRGSRVPHRLDPFPFQSVGGVVRKAPFARCACALPIALRRIELCAGDGADDGAGAAASAGAGLYLAAGGQHLAV